jgi:hypothetical protein
MEDLFDLVIILDIILSCVSIYYYIVSTSHNHRSRTLNVLKAIGVAFQGILYTAITIYSQMGNGSLVSDNPFVPLSRLVVTYVLVTFLFDSYKESHNRVTDE